MEPSDIGGIGDAIGVIGVDLDHIAARIGDRGDAALPVGKHVAAIGSVHRAAVIPDQRLIDPVPVDIAVDHGARAVVFRDQRIAVIEEARHPAAAAIVGLVEPAQRIIFKLRILCARCADQAVFHVIGEEKEERSNVTRGLGAISI